MSAAGIFLKIAITILIIAAAIALFIVAFNNWQKTILLQYTGIFYFFGFLFIVCIAISIIAAIWEI